MKQKNYLCGECAVCSYCHQSGNRVHGCVHPVNPIMGHCQHHDDLRSDQCGKCQDRLKVVELELKAFELAEAHQTMDQRYPPKRDAHGETYSLSGRIRAYEASQVPLERFGEDHVTRAEVQLPGLWSETAALQRDAANLEKDVHTRDNRIELLNEDLECIHLYLDDIKAPRADDNGRDYSIVGRIKTTRSPEDSPNAWAAAVVGGGRAIIGVDMAHDPDSQVAGVSCGKGHFFTWNTLEAKLMRDEGFCQICATMNAQDVTVPASPAMYQVSGQEMFAKEGDKEELFSYEMPQTKLQEAQAIRDIQDGKLVMPTVIESDVCVSLTEDDGDPPLVLITPIFPCPECGAIKGETCKPTCTRNQYK
jgi:hypothetical protein